MYALVGLYLLTPILSAWLMNASEKDERLYLSLWTVTLFYPILQNVLILNTSHTGILYYFTGCAGYFLFGHYLQHYGNKIKLWHTVVIFAIALCSALATRLLHIKVDYMVFIDISSIFMAAQALFWWKLIKTVVARYTILQRWQSALAKVSALTFGIYLVHVFIMRTVQNVPVIASMPQVCQILVTVVLTFVLSLLFSWFVSLTPLGHKLIGYQEKK